MENNIQELTEKINKLLETIELSSNSNTDEINNYINNFSFLKKDIDNLLNSKNPISFIIQLKKIKESFFIHLENLIDFIEKEISMDNTQKYKLLNDLKINPLNFSNNNKEKYIMDSKYFFEGIYFETYSKIDSDFKHFIQKILSLKDNKNIKEEILKEEKYKKYTELLNFLEKNSIVLKDIKAFDNDKKIIEYKFGYEVIKQYLRKDKTNEEKIKFMNEFYSFFDIKSIDLKYSKSVNINNIINFDTINKYKESQLDNEIIGKLDNILENYKNNFNFEFYIEIFKEINKNKDLDGTKRGYLWGYIRNKIKNIYNIDNSLFLEEKIGENIWVENRVNYRVDLRNDKSKEETYKFMDGFNQFRNIILNIQDSIFSDLYKVYILKILSEKLSLKKDTYNNFKYFMLYILPKNYLEYCKIYTFFSEFELYKEEKSIFKLSILNYLFFGILIVGIFFYISWILGVSFILIIFGTYWKNINFKSKKTNIFLNLRPHLAIHGFGYIIALFYLVLSLSNNGFFEVKIELLEKINKHQIVWQKLDETSFYNSSSVAIANILQYNQKKD